MRWAVLFLSGLVACGDIRTVREVADPEPKISYEIVSTAYSAGENNWEQIPFNAVLNTDDKAETQFLMFVDWEIPHDFVSFHWLVFFRRGDQLELHLRSPFRPRLGSDKPLMITLDRPLPEAVEFRIWVKNEEGFSCVSKPETCPLVRSILLHQ